ncbi:hypothetical protein GCM10017562_07230 [Streptomyces roseofulvus]|uniref:DUF3592 domain-containing protein n=1 Tax=Streptomyces roseofulvus TaxID=33902 RepID=UPI0031F9AB86
MGWYGYLGLWCAAFGGLALIGYVRYLTGATEAQRTVRTVGRIEHVTPPRHGDSRADGISVVVSFQDPSTGAEFTVTDGGEAGERGERIRTAWVGRPIGVHYPRGNPHAYRFTQDATEGPRGGLGRPNFALFLVYAGVVTVAAIERGWPWALLGFAGPWSCSLAYHLPENVRDTRRRRETLAAMTAVPGRVVAVLKRVSTDEDGHTVTTHVPVVTFTTRDGTTVTAYCDRSLRDPEGSYGRELTIHHAPDDPADFTPNLAGAHRAWRQGIVIDALGSSLVVATAVVGAVAL